MIWNTPNILSVSRIAAVPLITALFYIGGPVATWISVTIFFFACWSDFFDGQIARSTGQSSVLGKFLDSTSDKILVGGVLMLLVAFGRITGIWIVPALIIFVREILIAGLREFLGLHKISVHISWTGKWKTTVQMLASGFLMAGDYGRHLIPHSVEIGEGIFLIATILTIISAWDYLTIGYHEMKKLDAAAEQKD